MSEDVLVRVEKVSKKYCRSLKRSLWYGVQDVSAEMFGRKGTHDELRKNEFWALDDVSFELKRGQCLGLIGPNGAGKSTLLKMLNGLVKPDTGRITMRGRVGALIELGAGFNPILTARENIYVNSSVLGFSKKEIDRKFDAIVDFAEIEEFIDTPVQNFSSGMKVRLGFAVASQLDPDVLLVDEVLAVGDARFSFKCINRISSLIRDASVVFVSHSMPLVSRMCSVALSLNKGKVAYLGTNVGEAIGYYLSEVELQTEGSPEQSDYFVLDSIESSGKPSSESDGDHVFSFRESMQLRLSFLVKRPSPECFVNMVIMDLEGKPVAQCLSSQDGIRFSAAGQLMRVGISLNALLLNPGRYFIHFGLVEALPGSQFGKILYQNRLLAKLSVGAGVLSWAPVQFSASWDGDMV